MLLDSTATRYGVLCDDVEHEIEIRRSRFITFLGRVEREDEAREFVDLVRSEHRSARHHCTAFVLGPDRMLQRSNDDGEPAGTAGVPMLEALTQFVRPGEQSPDASDLVAVVVRYFGGVLLGAGGLVRAYSDSVSQALSRARFATRQRMQVLGLAVPLDAVGRIENDLRNSVGVAVLSVNYSDAVAELEFAVADEATARERVDAQLAALTQGEARVKELRRDWVDLSA